MSVLDFILTRRSCLASGIGAPGPSAAQIETIVTAGVRVPDHGRCSPWRVQVLGAEEQVRLGDVVRDAFANAFPTDATLPRLEVERQRLGRAPTVLVVSYYPNHDKMAKVPTEEQLLSVGAFCMNILHAAHAMGFAAQWLTEWIAYNEAIKRALGHQPATVIAGFIYIGTSLEPPKERPRVGPADILLPVPG
jgi:nitroreductase